SYLFAINVVFLALAAVGMAAGIGATVQNYRCAVTDRRVPRWLAAGLTGVAGGVLGAVLVAARAGASAGPGTGGNSQALSALPSFTAQQSQFAPATLSGHL